MWLAKRGVPAVVPFFRVFAQTPLRVVVSRTLALPKLANPTEEEVEHWHGEYIATLKAIHTQFKAHDDPPLLVHDNGRPKRQ
jgi:hypothetical protein